ncbi:MAG TPA: polysaccharide deacetylase family protein [Burkholderiaceae bacterium]|nr:polysaccharide deacetylase family protein [Burkholderiaceae bacterium]
MSAVFSCSLDDGYPSDMRAAELLQKNGLNATFFIPIKNREGQKVLSPAEIREIGEAFEVGSHTHDHCFLKNLPIREAQYQVNAGKSRLEDLLGRRVNGFCYPGGKYRPEHADLVSAAGFRYARTTVNLCFDAGDHPFEMPTTFQFYPHDRNVYLRNFAKGGSWGRRRDGLRLALEHKNWLDRLYALFDYSTQNDGVFHLWGHTKDIDELGAWQEFDRFLAHVAANVTEENRLTNEQLAAKAFLG